MHIAIAILCLQSFITPYAAPPSGGSKLHLESRMPSRLEQEKVAVNAQLLAVKVKDHREKLFAVVSLRVRFTVRNDLDRTLLVVPEAVKVVGTRFAKTSEELRLGPYLLDRLRPPSYGQPALLSITDHSSARVKAIRPGSQWEWDEDLAQTVERRSSRSTYPPEVGVEELQKLDGFWCQFQIAFWPHTMNEEGEHLQQQWREYGSLLSESITSSPIRLSLKK